MVRDVPTYMRPKWDVAATSHAGWEHGETGNCVHEAELKMDASRTVKFLMRNISQNTVSLKFVYLYQFEEYVIDAPRMDKNMQIFFIFFFISIHCLHTLLLAVNYFSKKLYLRCLLGFWIHLCTEAVFRRCSLKKVILEISQNSQENACVKSLLIKLQASGLQLY